ncbi:MAG: UvrD-helicase domain-containing protein [bacterium]
MTATGTVYIEKPEILSKVAYDESGVIEASAGTGKTYTIERMVVDLVVEQDVPITDILVVTFTERATEELVGRVRKMLRNMLKADGEDDLDPETSYWEIGEDERDRLKEALRSFDQAPVFTIHGFCNRILQEYAFQNQQLLELDVIEGSELFNRVFPKVLRETFAVDDEYRPVLESYLENNSMASLKNKLQASINTWEDIWPNLDEEQFERLKQHLWTFIDSFDEVNEGLKQVVEDGAGRYGADKLDRVRKAFEDTISTFKETDTIWDFLGTLNRISDSKDDPIPYLAKIARNVDGVPDPVNEHIVPIDDADLSPLTVIINQFAGVMEDRLEREKSEKGFYTYDDMLEMVRSGLDDPRMGQQLIQTIRDDYNVAIIDEFQDTDPKQWEIFRKIFYESGSSNPCYLVGDPKQAIYGFRGADVRIYRKARDRVGNILPLSTNYRSTPELIRAYNRILEPEDDSRFFSEEGNNSYDTPVDAGFEEKWFGTSQTEKASPIIVKNIQAESVGADEYRRTIGRQYAREIKQLLEDDRPFRISDDDGDEAKPLEAGDIFVLVTSGREAELVSRYLRAEDVPYSFYKQEGLFTSDQARHFLSVLKAVLKPGDRSRRLLAWNSPFFNVPLTDLERTDDRIDEEHPLFQRLIEWNEVAESGDVGRLIHSMLHDSGILRRVIYRNPGERAYSNYQQLGETFIDWWRNESLSTEEITTRLGQFVREERDAGDVEEDEMYLESERSAVQIMTMYKSKGLQAPVVFLYGGWGRPPGQGSYTFYPDDETGRVRYFGSKRGSPYGDNIDRYRREEDERLMYVAMTRAEGRLYLPLAENEDPGGSIGPLMDRLSDMTGRDHSPEDGSVETLIDFDTVEPDNRLPSVPLPARPESPEETDVSDSIGDWDSLEFGSLRADRRLYTESYSSVSRNLQDSRDQTEEHFTWGEKQPVSHAIQGDEELPSGPKTGLFVHELFEEIDFGRVDAHAGEQAGFDQWKTSDRLNGKIGTALDKYDLLDVNREQIYELLWRTLTGEVKTGDLTIDALCSVPRLTKEMEFWLPIPEEGHLDLSDIGDLNLGEWQHETGTRTPFPTDRGYLRGYIDLVFEWDGKIYAADWKTDTFPDPGDYRPSELENEVTQYYQAQKLFYTLGLARVIARSDRSLEDRFGGFFYFFVRGMTADAGAGDPEQGVYFYGPDVSDLSDIEARCEELLSDSIRRKKVAQRLD